MHEAYVGAGEDKLHRLLDVVGCRRADQRLVERRAHRRPRARVRHTAALVHQRRANRMQTGVGALAVLGARELLAVLSAAVTQQL